MKRGYCKGAFFVNNEGRYAAILPIYAQCSSSRIDYVGGFESGKYAYFATRQGKTLGEDAPIQSRLVRVCTGDSHFYSYTEVRDGSQFYSDVLSFFFHFSVDIFLGYFCSLCTNELRARIPV